MNINKRIILESEDEDNSTMKNKLVLLYHDARLIIYEKYKNIEQLLPYIFPVHHEYFKILPHEEYVNM